MSFAISTTTTEVQIANFPTIQQISAVSLPLPDGAAKETKQDTQITILNSIDQKTVDPYEVQPNFFAVPTISAGGEIDAKQNGVWDVSINNFPSGLATETGQSDSNNYLNLINQKIATENNQTTQITYLTGIYNEGAKDSSVSAGNASLSNIDFKLPSNLTVTSTRLLVDPSGVTSPISAVSLPLPSGASTSALQTTGNSSLSSIDLKTLDKISTSPTNYNVTPTSSTTALSSASCRAILLVADDTNTGTILVGGSSVSVASNIGTPLTAGDSRHYAPISNANLIYHASSASGQILHVEVIP